MQMIPAYAPPVFNCGYFKNKGESAIHDLYIENSSRMPGYNHICNALIETLIVLIIRIMNEKYSILRPFSISDHPALLVNSIKEFMNVHCTGKITLDMLSAKFLVNKYYIVHLFKELTGETPIQYHLNRRIDEAKKLLLTTGMNVQDIAFSIGYTNPCHFYKPFKKITGYTPDNYRKKAFYENISGMG